MTQATSTITRAFVEITIALAILVVALFVTISVGRWL